MDHTVVGSDAGSGHLRTIDDDAAGRRERQFATLHGLDHARLDVLGQDLAPHDVVPQNSAQLRLVVQQRVEISLRDLSERFVGRREDSERALAVQGVNETRGFQCGGEHFETAGGDGSVDDVFGLGRDTGQRDGTCNEELLHGMHFLNFWRLRLPRMREKLG